MTFPDELEAYRDRLMTRAAGWPDRAPEDLAGELERNREQIGLLERSCLDLKARLDRPPESVAEREAVSRKHALQDRMREITAAYAEALSRHLATRSS